MRIDKTSRVPIYKQIEALIENKIASEELTPGKRLPPDKEFAKQLSVNTRTLSKALNRLVTRGLLERRKKLGTIIAEASVPCDSRSCRTQTISSFDEFPKFIPSKQIVLRLCVLEFENWFKTVWAKIIDAFEKEHVGIKVEMDYRTSNEPLHSMPDQYDVFPVYDWQLPQLPAARILPPDGNLLSTVKSISSPKLRLLLDGLGKNNHLLGIPCLDFIPVLIGNISITGSEFHAAVSSRTNWMEFLRLIITQQKAFKKEKLQKMSAALSGCALEYMLGDIQAALRNFNTEKTENELLETLGLLQDFQKISQNGVRWFCDESYHEDYRKGLIGVRTGSCSTFASLLPSMRHRDLFIARVPRNRVKDMISSKFMCVSALCEHPREANFLISHLLEDKSQNLIAESKSALPVNIQIAESKTKKFEAPLGFGGLLDIYNAAEYSYNLIEPRENQLLNVVYNELRRLLTFEESPRHVVEKILEASFQTRKTTRRHKQ